MTRILILLAILLAVGFVVWRFAAPQPSQEPARPWPGPANISELTIKGVLPDGSTSWNEIEVPPSPPPALERGKDLFAKACAACHGAEGKGDGILTKNYDLNSIPANLTKPLQSIKIRSTASGAVPTDADLFRTLTRGLPNTAMWSYRALPAEDRWSLVHYVKSLGGDAYKSAPKVANIPAKLEKNAGLLETGGTLYRNVCLNCHGAEGLGGNPPIYDSESGKQFPGLKFAQDGGKLMLGGSSDDDIARTLMTGFHSRSPMRSFQPYFYPHEAPTPSQKIEGDRKLWGTVFYSRELINAQAK